MRFFAFLYPVAIISLVFQKGGGKNTLSRLIAREYANAGWSVKIADLDIGQGTSFKWQGCRLQSEVSPIIPVERFGTVEQALKFTAALDLLILDAPPNSNAATLKIVQASAAVILPTGLSLIDVAAGLDTIAREDAALKEFIEKAPKHPLPKIEDY